MKMNSSSRPYYRHVSVMLNSPHHSLSVQSHQVETKILFTEKRGYHRNSRRGATSIFEGNASVLSGSVGISDVTVVAHLIACQRSSD